LQLEQTLMHDMLFRIISLEFGVKLACVFFYVGYRKSFFLELLDIGG